MDATTLGGSNKLKDMPAKDITTELKSQIKTADSADGKELEVTSNLLEQFMGAVDKCDNHEGPVAHFGP